MFNLFTLYMYKIHKNCLACNRITETSMINPTPRSGFILFFKLSKYIKCHDEVRCVIGTYGCIYIKIDNIAIRKSMTTKLT